VKDLKPLRHSFGEQTYLNYRIFDLGIDVFELDYRFNSMSIMNRLTGMTRLDSYFIYYAGWPEGKIFDDIDRDIERWKEKPYEYKRNIFVFIGGGIGDQMCVEPFLRYLREFLYPDANIYGLSSVPRLFQHIEGVTIQRNYPKGLDAAVEMNAHPSNQDNSNLKLVHPLCHGLDYVTVACVGRILPDFAKEPKLTYSDEDLEEVTKICPNLKDLTLIHPGVGWQSKTFPVEWWQKIIDESGTVGIIGKQLLIDEDGTPQHSYLPVECPENGFDFRDKLSLGGLIALLSQAHTLVTNDSAPVHLAGAFDNNIVLIPTCKHPDFILPHRKGSKYHKAWALCKKTLYDDNLKGYLASDMVPWRVNKCDNILDYLPEPEEVITLINSLK